MYKHLDYHKVFDSTSVPYCRLLCKLKGYCVSDDRLFWIANLLHKRTQRVVVEGAYTQGGVVFRRVPYWTYCCLLLILMI